MSDFDDKDDDGAWNWIVYITRVTCFFEFLWKGVNVWNFACKN